MRKSRFTTEQIIGFIKQAEAAVGEGAAVVSQIHQYPASRQPVLPLPPEESHAPALHA